MWDTFLILDIFLKYTINLAELQKDLMKYGNKNFPLLEPKGHE